MRKEKYILMYQNDAVLSFAVYFGERNKIEILEKLEHFDKAPYGINNDIPIKGQSQLLFAFFNKRIIRSNRCDYADILKATKCRDAFELSFKGHGLSLSNQYWYKKKDEDLRFEDINFFTNKWDDSFAKAVLSKDYQALEHASLNVPDIVTPGWAIKGWLYEDGPTLYKLGIAKDGNEEPLGEVLASRLAKRLLKQEEVTTYELKIIDGHYASCCKSIVGLDEEMIPISNVLPSEINLLYSNKETNRENSKKFFERIKEIDLPNIEEFFVRLMCLRTLCFVNDLHFGNISVIRNLSTGKIRIAPIYDLAGAFGSAKFGKEFISKIDKSKLFIVYFFFGNLDPSWDYSWYDPERLIGFEDEIRETLSKSAFYTEELIDNIINVYQHQKASLDKMKNKQ